MVLKSIFELVVLFLSLVVLKKLTVELLGAGWEAALVAVLLTWRWEDLGSTPGVDLLDFSLLFFGF